MATNLERELEKTQAELLRAIRGKLTTSALSAKLGYKFNQVARWEKGERRLLWTDFVAICEARRLPLAAQLTDYLGYGGDLRDTAALTKTLLGGKSIEEAVKAAPKGLPINRSKLSRWVNGKAEPTFLDVYALLSSAVNSMSLFERLVDLSKVPTLAARYEIFCRQRELAFSLPWLDALMEALLVGAYRDAPGHDVQLLGRVAGLPARAVTAALADLEAAGMVKNVGGKYEAIEIGIDYRGDKQRMIKNILHWLGETARTVENLPTRPLQNSLVAFSVMSLSREAHAKALKLFRDFNRALHELGTEDRGPKDKVIVQVSSLMDAASFSEAKDP